jgi:hypothetical protein
VNIQQRLARRAALVRNLGAIRKKPAPHFDVGCEAVRGGRGRPVTSVQAEPEIFPENRPLSMPVPCDNRPGGSRFPALRSALLTIFWHCGHSPFSFRTRSARAPRQRTVNGFARGFLRLTGSGNADSQRKVRSSGWSGCSRPCASGCVHVHPAYWRASASYRPLRAVWAFAPGHSGVAREHQNPSALMSIAHRPKRNASNDHR